MSGNHVVQYALTLECRQFLAEMARARREARDAAQGIGGSFGAAMVSARQDAQGAQQAVQGFNAVQASLSRALGGDFAGAAGAAAQAVKGLTSALVASPWLAVAAAALAVVAAVVKAAESAREYRERVKEAREENLAFVKSLEEVAEKWQAGRDQSAFEKRLKQEDSPVIERSVRMQERRTEAARKEAVEAAQELQEAQSRRHPNEKRVEELKARRDEAKAEYELQLTILGRYKDMYEDWDEKQKQAVEDYRDAAKEAAKQMEQASKAERDRREYEAVKDDPEKLMSLAAKRRAEVADQYGNLFRDDYEERLKRGAATEEEIKARREIEEMQERALELEKKKTEEAKKQRDLLAKSRESALVEAGDFRRLQSAADRLTARADEKWGKWTPERAATATQEELEVRQRASRLSKEATAARDNEIERRKDLAVKSGDANALEQMAQGITRGADRKWGKLTNERFKDQSREELDERGRAAELRETAKKMREEKKPEPWSEGVVAAQSMSIGDVFNHMRGMGGATMERDRSAEILHETGTKVSDIEKSVRRIANALAGDGVQ